jgi:hypothetical protein
MDLGVGTPTEGRTKPKQHEQEQNGEHKLQRLSLPQSWVGAAWTVVTDTASLDIIASDSLQGMQLSTITRIARRDEMNRRIAAKLLILLVVPDCL